MKKKYHCCIPGCLTYDTLDNFVQLPSETEWRNKWLSVIPRKDWIVTNSTVACFKHFQSGDFLVRISTAGDKGKDQVTSSTLCIKWGTVPKIFPKKPQNPPVGEKLCPCPEVFEDLEKEEFIDCVVELWYIKLMYRNRLGDLLSAWNAIEETDSIVFYSLDLSEIPRIKASVKIDNFLCVTVTLAGKKMDPGDLTWILPVDGKLSRWSQLKALLQAFIK
ncbi:uncharacterized protein LOC116163926 [Photinus pyralis]|uniref:uncharacterized protein LOC116163926 n=1 Tax=Photinus pyralis TaxID=7054 RepID=UPI0012674452|nr:uncharacterized protein LOC116163926 [Photinus pyralis]